MSTVTEAVRAFLTAHTHPDLAAAYTADMEVQVNVAADGGQPVADHRNTYADGAERWYSFRVPKNAKDAPYFNDYPLRFSLDAHAEAIGMTGWDWKNRRSRWVAFDFDDITGHACGVGISDEELQRVRAAAQAIPWVTVRKSTGGKGLHLYVFFADPPETSNHTEHAALGRAILAKMSLVANFDFSTKVDACGGNMWVWHRKMIGPNGDKVGLHLLKQGEPLQEAPAEWQTHLDVVRHQRTKVRVAGIADSDEAAFEELSARRPAAKLDDVHRQLMDWIVKNGCTCIWDQDHRLMTTHTAALKAAHEALKLKGVFETLATGRQQGDHNCFCFPLRNGAWTVYRYTPGTGEATTWRRSEHNWTYCDFNRPVDVKAAAVAYGGIKAPNGSFVFESAEYAQKALKALGAELDLPTWIVEREVTLKPQKGELVASIPSQQDDQLQDMRQKRWLRQKNLWVRVYELEPADGWAIDGSGDDGPVIPNLDDHIRHLVTPVLEDAGWAVRDSKGRWIDEPKSNVKSVLKSWGMSDSESEAALGRLVINVWDLVNLPFQDEYPSGRRWNRDAARLAKAPTEEDREMSHSHWDMIFDHCGTGLDEAVAENEWCKRHGVRTGGEYLRLWAAILFQRPTHPLPYLFFFSDEQNTGKSSFHQSLGLLMLSGKGYVEADTALTNQQGFNKQLAGAILCYVEETDLSNTKGLAYNRIKNWVTGDNLSIHPKGIDPYMMPNTTHWVQCANTREACPVFAGDSRIVVVEVPPLPRDEIPWTEDMKPALENETPDFLRTLLDMSLPDAVGRLWLPVLETAAKREAIAGTQQADQGNTRQPISQDQLVDAVRQFIAEMLYWELGGHRIPFGRRYYWEGTFSTLGGLLGWDGAQPNQVSHALRAARDQLREYGIEIVLPEEGQRTGHERKVTIAESWLIGPEVPPESMVDDYKRFVRLMDDLPPGANLPSRVASDSPDIANHSAFVVPSTDMPDSPMPSGV
jgi:hypothetical protein